MEQGGDTASLCFLQPQMVGGAKARSLAYARAARNGIWGIYAPMARAERNSSTAAAVTVLISTTRVAPALSRKRLARTYWQ